MMAIDKARPELEDLRNGIKAVVPFRRVIDPFGERHLPVGQFETVLGSRHRVGRRFQVPAHSVEAGFVFCTKCYFIKQ